MARSKRERNPSTDLLLPDDPLWYKDAIIYETHVRAFCDSNGDGIGDFRGLTTKLDYLQDLGVTALWILPFYPSPLRDDGYDIAVYDNVHPDYGTLRDFRAFLREAHRRGLRVITELVLNHTSDQHPWFQRSRRAAPGSRWRNYYVWSDHRERYAEARIIFKDFERSNWSWDPVARAYYWHRFYSHQPDLNYDNPEVYQAVLRFMEFWFDMGVDGMRLDAVPYLFEREGTNCENLPETHEFLRKLRRHMDKRYPNRMFLAEANQWPDDAAAYFGDGDECNMNFHFPLMPRMFMATRLEDRAPIVDVLEQTPAIPEPCQWATFLRNHDELTLEMVTDEERDYMYRVYAADPRMRINLGIRRRLAPLLGNNRRTIELLNSLLFSLGGTPVLYYGDEIGMGDNIYLGDRNSVRTPMQWSADRNAGFSPANPQRLYLPVIIDPEYHYEAINVEAQQNNPHSLLWWMKRMIEFRRRTKALGRGTLEFLHPTNRKVLAYVRRHEGECILAVANLSRYVQCLELDLSAYRGQIPIEMFGQTPFPQIGELPYFLTLGPHGFTWFRLQAQSASEAPIDLTDSSIPHVALRGKGTWMALLAGKPREALHAILPDYLRECRWFGGKARRIKSAEIVETVPFPAARDACLAAVQVEYIEGEPEMYMLPLAVLPLEKLDTLPAQAVVAHLEQGARAAILYDALWDPAFVRSLLATAVQGRTIPTSRGELRAHAASEVRRAWRKSESLEANVLRAEQSNSAVVYGNRFILKLFRKLDEGVNPDLEIGRQLERKGFANAPTVVGYLEHLRQRGEARTVAVIHRYVPNEGNAWDYTLDYLRNYLAEAKSITEVPPVPPGGRPFLELLREEPPDSVAAVTGPYLVNARLLGRRTAELHAALADEEEDDAFTPEPFTPFAQRPFFQSLRHQLVNTMEGLKAQLRQLPEGTAESARRLVDLEKVILGRFRFVLSRKLTSMRIRTHGDYHLGQVLYTGTDFVLFDFEGEPARSIGERRLKRSPLRDVAGMLRSFDYAARTALTNEVRNGLLRSEDTARLEPWTVAWQIAVSATFLEGYLEACGESSFLPREREEFDALLEVFLLEKGLYEVSYELNNRPDWIDIPLRGILQILEGVE